MQRLEQTNERAADLYWLTFLLTGDREASLDVTIEALGFAQGANPFFSTWMLAWARRVVIAKALAVIRDELATSAHRTASKRAEESTLPPRNWDPDQDATKVVLERALLAIDVFPDALFCCRSSKGCRWRMWRTCWTATGTLSGRPSSPVRVR
jgi:hypothetical protein